MNRTLCPVPGSGCNWPEGQCLDLCHPIGMCEPFELYGSIFDVDAPPPPPREETKLPRVIYNRFMVPK